MDRWTGKVVVVTGASSGIGLATAKALIQHGLIVVGLARRKEKMEEDMATVKLGKGKFYAVECDISKEDDVCTAFGWITKNVGKVQILINNAGVIAQGKITETDNAVLKNMIDVNVMGTVYCIKEALKIMQANNLEAHIININSTVGHRVFRPMDKDLNIYIASKYAITGLCETLVRELLGQKIRVTSVSPGLVKTGMTVGPFSQFRPDQEPALESEDIADAIVYVIGTPPRVQVKELLITPLGEKFL